MNEEGTHQTKEVSDKERPERMTNGGESEERAHSRLITLGLSFTLFTLHIKSLSFVKSVKPFQ